MPLRVSAVRAAMANVLEVAFGTEVQVATAPDQLTPPCLLLAMPTVDYGNSGGREPDSMRIPIHGVVPRIHDQAAVDLVDAWISGSGPRSVVGILQADPTLGGVCLTLEGVDAVPEIYPTAQGDLPSYRWTVQVWG